MSKRGLPTGLTMRHDSHYVEELARSNRTIGKIIPIEKIEPNPDQPRVEFGDLTDLTNSIREHGVLEPLLVKPVKNTGMWMIIAGERRWRSATLAGLKELPCIELDLDDEGVAEIALIENLQRKDLTIWEEADGLAALAERYGYTHDQIAKKIGKSRTTITESMTIAGIQGEARTKCIAASISAKSTLLEVARQFDDEAMIRFVDNLTSKPAKRNDAQNGSPKLKTVSGSARATENRFTEVEQPIADENVFFYESNLVGSFQVEIRFGDEFQKKDILKALKETFEHVKTSK